MVHYQHFLLRAAVSLMLGSTPAIADSLGCQSINGNLNCAGSSGMSCQTVDGRKVCTSGHGDVVQSFGATPPSHATERADQGIDDDAEDTAPAPRLQLEQRGPSGHAIRLQRDGARLDLRTDGPAVGQNWSLQ